MDCNEQFRSTVGHMDAVAVICSVAKHRGVLDGYNSFRIGTEK